MTYLESRVIRLNNLVERNHPNFRFMQRMVSSIEREAVNGGGHINQSSEDCLEKFLKGLSTAVVSSFPDFFVLSQDGFISIFFPSLVNPKSRTGYQR